MMVAASGEIQKLTNLFCTIVKENPLTPKTFVIPLHQLQENKATVGSHALCQLIHDLLEFRNHVRTEQFRPILQANLP